MIAVKLHILTRKTLGGLETDLDSRVLTADGTPLPGLYAAARSPGSAAAGARLPRAGGHLPGRLHLLRPDRRARRRLNQNVMRRCSQPRTVEVGARRAVS